jgi:AraC-like DNA-binding protein
VDTMHLNIKKSDGVEFKHAIGKIDILGNVFHEYNEIYLLINGDVEFINNHMSKKISPYQLVVIPRGQYHQFVVKGDAESYERLIIHIYPGLLDSGIIWEAISGKEILSLDKDHRIIKNILHLKNALYTYDDKDFSHILPAIATDLIFLIKQLDISQKKDSGSIRPLALEIMEYINENYHKNISLEDISKKFFISISSLCHIFKSNFGISIKKYIIEKRMNGVELSMMQGKSATDACRDFGFSNYSTFFRAYKKHFGISPSEKSRKY